MRIAIGSDHAGFTLKQHLSPCCGSAGTRSTIAARTPRHRWITLRSVRTSPARSSPRAPIGASFLAAAARESRWPQTRWPVYARRSATTSIPPGCHASTTTPTSWPWVGALSRPAWPTKSSTSGCRPASKADGISAGSIRSWRSKERPANSYQLPVMRSGDDCMAKTIDTPSRWRTLADTDPEIAGVLRDERHRQNSGLELIASENFVSRAVMEAQGSVLTNKYAEGYPGKRYYGGCEFVDVAESLAIARARELFQADHANVQPHSGAQANMSVYLTLLKPGDTVLGMNLAHGGHLTHGHPLNFSGKLYTIVPYGVRQDDERIDYEELERLAHEHAPKMIMVGASAYPRVIDFPRIAAVARAVGAPMVVDMAHIAGLVAAGVHPSPVPHADFVTTTTHKTLRGPRGGMILCRAQYAKDLDRTVFPGIQGGPLMHIIAAKAVCFKEALEPGFAEYQRQIVANAQQLAAGLSSAGFRLVSGGTDNHLMLVDVFSKGLTGKVAEGALGKAGITVNKNAIPFDQNPPMVASGIRVGTPAITSRGMGEAEMDRVAEFIAAALAAPDDDTALGRIKGEVEALCRKFPLYPEVQG